MNKLSVKLIHDIDLCNTGAVQDTFKFKSYPWCTFLQPDVKGYVTAFVKPAQ